MKSKVKILILAMITLQSFAMDVFDSISTAIRNGDYHQVAAYFGTSVDLTIIDQENVYSRAQAELVLKDFFDKNHPKSFTILHKGTSHEKTQYAIGNLTTMNGKSFRVSFYVVSTEGKESLQELRIELK
jgi:hypothetical protein